MILRTAQLLQGVLTKSGAGMSLLIPLTRYQLDIWGILLAMIYPPFFSGGQCESSILIKILCQIYYLFKNSCMAAEDWLKDPVTECG